MAAAKASSPIVDHQGEGSYSVHLLGGFSVCRGDDVAEIPTCCERLVAYLAINGTAVDRNRLAGTLWMDKSGTRASANLRSALWRLRKAISDLICETDSRIQLTPGTEVDLHTQKAWASRLRAMAPLPSDLDTEVRHVSCELLPDWYDDWVVMERERFRQRMLHAIEAMVDCLVREGRFDEAIDAGIGAIALEPLRETSHRMVIAAHLAEGNRGEAVRHVEMCRRMFQAELGFDVGPSLEEFRRGGSAKPRPAP